MSFIHSGNSDDFHFIGHSIPNEITNYYTVKTSQTTSVIAIDALWAKQYLKSGKLCKFLFKLQKKKNIWLCVAEN